MSKYNKSCDKTTAVMSVLNHNIDNNSLNIISETTGSSDGSITVNNSGTFFTGDGGCNDGSCNNTCWSYWTDYYYPAVIHHSYPVYIQERAKDNGKKAFEIIKILSDKKILKLEKVKDFIDVMDTLIKIL